jgi:prepilin-type N-terminal cleavage/methylation domain-containing protein
MRNRNGFTLVEILVVLGISALLSGMAIAYSNVSRNATALTVEEAKISQFILRAKSLAIATYGGTFTSGSPVFCGYGVTFNLGATPQTYSIFAYSPVTAPTACPTGSSISSISSAQEIQYSSGSWHVPLTNGVRLLSQADSLVTILFYPPDPRIFLSHDNASFVSAPLKVHLQTTDGNNSANLSINAGGQILFQ